MGRRAKPPNGTAAAKRQLARKSPKDEDSRVRDLERRLADALQREAEALGRLQTRNRELAEAQEQQTATSEILRVIASSPTDVQPVFDAVAESAARLCEAQDASIFRREGDRLAFVAHHGPIAQRHGDFSLPLVPGTVGGRSVLESRTVQVADLQNEDREFPEAVENARRFGFRTILSVPLLREGIAIGGIQLRRTEVQLFSDRQIALLQTFADQAVIAIENVRLFTELQTSNRELTTALDTQTATSDILRVISQSPTDVQPVFDAILASAVRLLRAHTGALTRIAGDQIALAGLTSADDAGEAALRARFPQPLHSEDPHAQVIRGRVPLNVADAHTDARWPEAARAYARVRGYRSAVVVPLLRHDEALGSIGVNRREPGGFTDDEIALLQTFADQAVIAIGNARLLSALQARTQELTRSVEQLTALGDVGRAVSSSLDLDTVLTTIVGRAVQLSGTDGGTIFEYDEDTEEFSARATLNADESQSALLRATRLRRGEGAVGQMAVTREPLQIPDIAAEGAYEGRLRGALLEAGTRAVLAIPLLHEERTVGGLVVTRRRPGAFTAEIVEILRTFATQSALAIQNARLFREIEAKGRQLAAASQHKSEFLANMSHELRTPLNAIIGFSEVLVDRMFGELTEKQEEYLKDIYASGTHLLSLINDILDLSKIEAGRMELEPEDFDLPAAIDDALLLVRERAGRRGIALERHVEAGVGEIRADARKVKQALLNLLSNAVKFTPDGGRIDVRIRLEEGNAEISVTDSGIGIAAEDQEAVFEEFRQVGTADKRAEGTGLGLALCRKFVELHGGRIWVQSELGRGSTFTFTIPVRCVARDAAPGFSETRA
jgi:two-component system, NtrC family, sensor kinase